MLPSAPTASRGCAARRLQSRQLPRGASRPSRSSQRDVAGGRAERPRPNPSGERDPSSRPSRRLNIRESTRADPWTMPKDPRGGPIRPRELPRAQEDLPASSLVAPRSRERERGRAHLVPELRRLLDRLLVQRLVLVRIGVAGVGRAVVPLRDGVRLCAAVVVLGGRHCRCPGGGAGRGEVERGRGEAR